MFLRHRCIQHLCVVALACAGAASLTAAELSPEGLWKTTDDRTGKPRGIVRIYQENGALYGRVEATLDPAEARQVCDLCTDERRNKPVVGMIVMRGLRKNGGEYNGGDILDPDTGSVYRCKLRIEDQGRKLIVRGFIGFSLFGRTQTWTRQP
jgi:uncharacterized protein (DUF2147 family)